MIDRNRHISYNAPRRKYGNKICSVANFYVSCAEIERTGLAYDRCFQPVRVSDPLGLEQAKELADKMGFPHCAKPFEE